MEKIRRTEIVYSPCHTHGIDPKQLVHYWTRVTGERYAFLKDDERIVVFPRNNFNRKIIYETKRAV